MTAEWVTAIAAVPTAIATCFMAGTAWCALDTWKNQTKTLHQIKTYDELMLTVEKFYFVCSQIIFDIDINNKTITSFGHITDLQEIIKNMEQNISDKVIEKINHDIQTASSSIEKIISLCNKCKIYGDSYYDELIHIKTRLTHIFNFLNSYTTTVSNTHVNIDNKEIQEVLKRYITDFPTDNLQSQLKEIPSELLDIYIKHFKTNL